MIVDRRLRHAALIRVLGAVSAGDSPVVHCEDIEREWRRATGLRLSDLNSALRDMVDKGHLTLYLGDGARRDYEFTASGRSELRWQGAMLNAADWLVLLGARARGWRSLFGGQRPGGAERRHEASGSR